MCELSALGSQHVQGVIRGSVQMYVDACYNHSYDLKYDGGTPILWRLLFLLHVDMDDRVERVHCGLESSLE